LDVAVLVLLVVDVQCFAFLSVVSVPARAEKYQGMYVLIEANQGKNTSNK
jgi:hypothetical protein